MSRSGSPNIVALCYCRKVGRKNSANRRLRLDKPRKSVSSTTWDSIPTVWWNFGCVGDRSRGLMLKDFQSRPNGDIFRYSALVERNSISELGAVSYYVAEDMKKDVCFEILESLWRMLVVHRSSFGQSYPRTAKVPTGRKLRFAWYYFLPHFRHSSRCYQA